MIDLEQLKGSRLFEGVSLAPVAHLLCECDSRALDRGEVLISPGESKHKFYLVLSGHLRVHLDSLEGPAIGLLGPGDSLGEFSIIDQQPASSFVVAADPCRLLVIGERIFWVLIDHAPGVARNIIAALTQRVRRNNILLADGVRAQREHLRHGTTDPLTGLHNRRWVSEVLPREIRRSVCDKRRLSLMILCIDRFQEYNGAHGKPAGDDVLATLGRVLTEHLRPTDLVARFGSEEFIVILPNTDLAGARIVAERLRSAVTETAIMTIDGKEAEAATVSIGLAQLHPTQKMDSLIAAADAALRRAQRAGCDRVDI